MKIAILGAGPSGMMAAHAASMCGHYVDIFDKDPNQTRVNAGVFFLHEECDLALDATTVQQRLIGGTGLTDDQIAEAYGLKVYGKAIKKTSVLDVKRNPTTVGYNAGTAVQRLWDLYGGQVEKRSIENLSDAISLLDCYYDKIISTIPAPVLFPRVEYMSEKVWIKWASAPEGEAFTFYNINPHCEWYRCSALFGVFTQEYAHGVVPIEREGYNYREVIKVIGIRDPMPEHDERLLLTGRFGTWNKRFLTHTTYRHVIEWLTEGNEYEHEGEKPTID